MVYWIVIRGTEPKPSPFGATNSTPDVATPPRTPLLEPPNETSRTRIRREAQAVGRLGSHHERDGDGDRAKAISLLDEFLAISSELGMRPLMERVLSRREILRA